ncbi:MAG: AAA family ATPase [Candidatus Limnocylindria bacterium]
MRIERIELDGFGRFHDETWSLEPGLTVVHGANEAGKTTFMNAVRALLFGFDATREGRTWYPAFAGGRRGGRLVLATILDERWVIERHGERGGGGALTVRAPNGNQGGQETLDRLLHGADRDLFANVFAFGLGELQDLHTLSTSGVRGRIYGAGAGLGGASAVDLEKALRADLRDMFVPSGSKPPLNALLSRIESLRAEIAGLATQPQDYEAANAERAAIEARILVRREESRALRERASRLRSLRDAAPVLAELDEIAVRLDAGNAALDDLPTDVVAVLDRRIAQLEAAQGSLATIEEELAVACRERDAIRVDRDALERSDEIVAVHEAGGGVVARGASRAELGAGVARHASLVDDQLARVGGWIEPRLLELDDSIPSVQATRDAEERLAAARADAAATAGRWQAARADLEARETEITPAASTDDVDERRRTLRELQRWRAPSGPILGRPGPTRTAVAIGVALATLAIGVALGWPVVGVVVGLAAGAIVLVLPGLAGLAPHDRSSERAALLARAGLPSDAEEDAVAELADELATARARADLARDHAASLDQRRAEVIRLERARDDALARCSEAEGSWATWLSDRDMPADLPPSAAREILAAAGVARTAAAERERLRGQLASLEQEEDRHVARADALLLGLGMSPSADAELRGASVTALAGRLDRARAGEQRLVALASAITRLEDRRRPAADLVAQKTEELSQLLGAHGVSSADGLRSADAAAASRRDLQARAREVRFHLAGIAGSTEAVEGLAGEVRATDATAVEAELADVAAEAERLDAEVAEAHSRIGALAARISQLEAAEEIGALRQELAIVEGSAAAMARTWAVRAVTLRLLEETRHRYERERQPDVIRAAEAHFARITGGRYTRIVAPPGDASVRVETDGGESRVTDELSRGTAEQLYLALRFGLIEEFARHAEPLPVVMDDILVNFDAERAARAADAIRDLALRHQVLYFTCHAWTAEMLDPEGTRTLALA